ncbi:MAG: hypothetical protein NT087_05825 [Deltaproteobacteria bacterium]|nr:hypothetical protein [Deltaproteobacteria bacterium]
MCYFCGKAASEDEHAPPKQMFKNFVCDSITVPSCSLHNSNKGEHDQAIVSALLLPLYNGNIKYPLEKEVQKAVDTGKSSFERAKLKAIDSPLLKNPPESLKDLPNLTYLVSSIDINMWIKQLPAALVWDASKFFDPNIDWEKSIAWSPNRIVSNANTSLETGGVQLILKKQIEIQQCLESFDWADGWSASPRAYPESIYFFQIYFPGNNEVIFKHKFYNRYTWYMWFSASTDIISIIKSKISA